MIQVIVPQIGECGILLRGYAKTEPEVKDVVERLYRSAMQAYELGFGGIIILIPKEKDCGKTRLFLAEKLIIPVAKKTNIVSADGDGNSMTLNEGLAYVRMLHCSHTFIMSNKAIEYLTEKNVMKMCMAFHTGALVTGLAVRDPKVPIEEDDIYRGVIEGRISNIFAAWDVKALDAAGRFDSTIGVEEISVIGRLLKAFPACIAPILPEGQGGLDISTLRMVRWKDISSTKMQRQLGEAKRVGSSFELIKQGILLGYPK